MKKVPVLKASDLKKGNIFVDEKGLPVHTVKEITITPTTGITYIETKDGLIINVDKALGNGGLFKLRKSSKV